MNKPDLFFIKAKNALRHPGKIPRKLREFCHRLSSRALELDLIEAYKTNDSSAHAMMMNMARQYYGPGIASGPSLRAALDFKYRLSFARERLFRKRVCFDLGACSIGFKDLKIQCSSDSVLESTVYLDGFYDELTVLQTYESRLKPGDFVIDVGANIGLHSLALAKLVGDSGIVYSYEPTGTAAARLRANLCLNDIGNVIIRQTALGEEEGEIPFYDAANEFNHGVARYDPDGKSRVPVVRLDADLQRRTHPIALIKIDVEGMELRVIRGAHALLVEDRPIIVVEYNEPPWSLQEFVQAIPYETDLFRIPNTYRETFQIIDVHSPLPGFNNLLIVPRGRK